MKVETKRPGHSHQTSLLTKQYVMSKNAISGQVCGIKHSDLRADWRAHIAKANRFDIDRLSYSFHIVSK